MDDRRRAAALRERAHRLTVDANEAASDPERQHEIHDLLDAAAQATSEADAVDPAGRVDPRGIAR